MRQIRDLLHLLPEQTTWFLFGSLSILLITLLIEYKFQNKKILYTGLFLSVVSAGFAFALIDNFLHPWDEQFHALVAKNMMTHPLHPRLIDDLATGGSNHKVWAYTNTWLHKQPLFLWQIALSFKLFGANLIALRLPSIIMFALSACMVLSIAKHFINRFFALLAAVLFGFCGFSLDFISGVQGMDHNDIAFLFYITASFWSWMKYNETKEFKYVIFIGIFSGGAVLCKWLTGLIVFAGWGMIILMFSIKDKREWKNMLTAAGICLLIFIPWQIFCLINYPVEYQHELAYNSKHLFHAVENHGGAWTFYFEGMKDIYGGGDLLRALVILGLLITVVKGMIKKDEDRIFGALVFTLIYLFFMSAATKLPGYVLIVTSFGFIFMVTPFNELFEWIRKKKPIRLHFLISPLLIIIILTFQFQSKGVINRHHLKMDQSLYKWRNDLNYAVGKIRNSHHNIFLIKNETAPTIPALRFMTGKKVYIWNRVLENEKTLVIDLNKSSE